MRRTTGALLLAAFVAATCLAGCAAASEALGRRDLADHALAAQRSSEDDGAGFGTTLGPVVCDTLECPRYKVLERLPGDTELRRYDPGQGRALHPATCARG